MLYIEGKVTVFAADFVNLHHRFRIVYRIWNTRRLAKRTISGWIEVMKSSATSLKGHLKSTTVLYTAEIELRPTIGGAIGRKFDPETGTGFWNFK